MPDLMNLMIRRLLSLSFVTVSLVAQADESAKSLIDDCCRYREQIKLLHLNAADTRPEDQPNGSLPLKLEVWCDVVNDIYRCDRLEAGKDPATETRSVGGWQCQFANRFLSYHESKDSPPVVFFSEEEGGIHLIPRMQLLGMIPTGIKDIADPPFGFRESPWLQDLRLGQVEPLPADLIEVISKFEDVRDRADDLRFVKFTRNIKMLRGEGGQADDQVMSCQAVLDTRKGNQIIYAERRFTGAEDYSLVDFTNVSLKEWDGIWYPQRIVNESLSGKEQIHRDDITISDVEINSNKPFATLTAINPAPGSIVMGVPGQDFPQQWDGKKLVRAKLTSVLEGGPASSESFNQNNVSMLLWINGLIICSLVAAVLIRHRRTRGS